MASFTYRKLRRERMLEKMSRMRAAKERKRLARDPGDYSEPPHGGIVRHPNLSWAMRDDRTGETVWMPFTSVRDMTRRASTVARYYQP